MRCLYTRFGKSFTKSSRTTMSFSIGGLIGVFFFVLVVLFGFIANRSTTTAV